MTIRRISAAKVKAFQKASLGYWHEGLDEKQCREVKKFTASPSFPSLGKIFYWPKAKSYVIQDRLSDHVYCITKSYFDSL